MFLLVNSRYSRVVQQKANFFAARSSFQRCQYLSTDVEEKIKSKKVSVKRKGPVKRKFVDRIRIKATGGHGGNGCSSFVVEAPGKKRPNGGHGGRGGNVTIQADRAVQSLSKPTHHFKGTNGANGMSNDRHGRRGVDEIIKVPCGTLIKTVTRYNRLKHDSDVAVEDEDFECDEDETEIVDRLETIIDLDRHNASYMIAEGGKPGLGNRILAGKTTKFGRMRKQMPEGKTLGIPGTSGYFELELKTIADVGLVGYPNAGKSTLLSTISKAKPEIAAYPFTTLHPYVGIVEYSDLYRMSVADIPGLIDGAHRNIGLGHDFLRHIERTKVLLYVLDTAGSEGRSPLDDFRHLQNELDLYAPNITSRPSLIVANKMDSEDASKYYGELKSKVNLPVIPISALHNVDISQLLHEVRKAVKSESKKEDGFE